MNEGNSRRTQQCTKRDQLTVHKRILGIRVIVIVKSIKGQRISLVGHLQRMEEDRIPKKIFTQELEGTRRRGKPRKGWKEEVERGLQVLGVRRWRELVADRKKWKDIIRQAKAHSGL